MCKYYTIYNFKKHFFFDYFNLLSLRNLRENSSETLSTVYC